MKIVCEEVNVEEFCRICFEHKLDLVSCQKTLVLEDFTCTIEEILSLLSAEILPEFSTFHPKICSTCKELAEAAFALKIMYEKTSEVLKNLLTPFKKEALEDYKLENQDLDEILDNTTCNEEYINDSNEDEIDLFIANPELIEEEIILKIEDDHTTVEDKTSTDIIKDIPNIVTDTDEGSGSYKIKLNKPDNVLHLCPVCWKEIPNPLEFRKHVQSHKVVGKYMKGKPIPKQSRFFAQRNNTVTIFNKQEPKHCCPYCNENLPAVEFGIHLSNHEKMDDFYCDKCDRVFVKLRDFNLHNVRSHREEYPYKCTECNQGFVVKYNFDCHMLKHTLKEEDFPFACQECPRKFSNSVHLWRHMHIHKGKGVYGSQYKQYKCRNCTHYFRTKDSYEQHIQKCPSTNSHGNSHKTTTSDHYCQICGKTFNTYKGLYQHRTTHQKPFKKKVCELCGKAVRNMTNHMNIHTGKKRPPCVCHVCGKHFSMIQNLCRHYKSLHSNQEPYLCDVCGKSFRHYDGFKAHERIHIGNKHHICPVCGKGFLEKSYMKKHFRVHQKNKSFKYEF